MENKYISLEIKKRTPSQRTNDMRILQQLTLFYGDRAIDKIKEASRESNDKLYYQIKLFLLGQQNELLKETQTYVNGQPEEDLMQKAMAIIFKNWNRYKNLKILNEISDYCHDGLSRVVPGQDKKRFAYVRDFYMSGKGKCNINFCKLLCDITDPNRADFSNPNPSFNDDNAVKEFRTFTDALEKESGVDEYQLV